MPLLMQTSLSIAALKSRCKYWDILHPVFADRTSSRPAFTANNLGDDDVAGDLLGNTEEDGDLDDNSRDNDDNDGNETNDGDDDIPDSPASTVAKHSSQEVEALPSRGVFGRNRAKEESKKA